MAEAGYPLNFELADIKTKFSILDVTSALTGQDVEQLGEIYRLMIAVAHCAGITIVSPISRNKWLSLFLAEENGDLLDLIVKFQQAPNVYDAARLLLLGELEANPTTPKVISLEQPVYIAPPARLQELFNLAARHYQTRLNIEELVELRGHSEVLVVLDIGFSGGLEQSVAGCWLFPKNGWHPVWSSPARMPLTNFVTSFQRCLCVPRLRPQRTKSVRFTFKDPNKQHQVPTAERNWQRGFSSGEVLNVPALSPWSRENDRLCRWWMLVGPEVPTSNHRDPVTGPVKVAGVGSQPRRRDLLRH